MGSAEDQSLKSKQVMDERSALEIALALKNTYQKLEEEDAAKDRGNCTRPYQAGI